MQTTSFITKKATLIYRLISSFLILLISIQISFAAEDLESFCFDSRTNLKEVESSLQFLLLPKEKVFPRPKDACLDILTSTDRSKLLEKFLSKRYTLIAGSDSVSSRGETDLSAQHCRLELTTTKKRSVNTTDVRLGSKQRSAVVETKDVTDVSTSSLLLSLGVPGTLDMEGKSLLVECRGGLSGIYQLTFSYSEQYRGKVSSEVSVRANEPINVAQITNDLNNKSKVLGLPESLYQDVKGQENISYELQIK